jgi:hypothetical protein
MHITKHEGESFQNETVYISGQAFVRCNFVACTLVLRETVYYMESCTFDRCNWQLDCLLPWGSPDALNAVQVVIDLHRQGQHNLPAGGGDTSDQPAPPSTSPFA